MAINISSFQSSLIQDVIDITLLDKTSLQNEVDDGIVNDSFITPLTFANSAQLANKKNIFQQEYEVFDHFLNGVVGTRYSASQSGGSASIVGNNNVFGNLQIRTGTNTVINQRAGVFSNSLSFLAGQNLSIQKNFKLKYIDLPNGTILGYIKVGFMDSVTTGYGVDGIFFRIVDNGNLETVTRVSNTETVEDLGFRPNLSTFYNHKIIINSDGSQVNFYFDDMTTPVSTHTTNIPSASGAYLGEGFHVIRTTNISSNIVVELDWDYLKATYDTPLIF